jgi:predicted nuclease of predicted toxin-antitoxin system
MSLSFYMDEHVPSAITEGLRQRGLNVLTAQEDGKAGADDPELLDRATDLRRVFFTFDADFLREGARRQKVGEEFAGIVHARALRISFKRCIDDLELIAVLCEPNELANRVDYLPL